MSLKYLKMLRVFFSPRACSIEVGFPKTERSPLNLEHSRVMYSKDSWVRDSIHTCYTLDIDGRVRDCFHQSNLQPQLDRATRWVTIEFKLRCGQCSITFLPWEHRSNLIYFINCNCFRSLCCLVVCLLFSCVIYPLSRSQSNSSLVSNLIFLVI